MNDRFFFEVGSCRFWETDPEILHTCSMSPVNPSTGLLVCAFGFLPDIRSIIFGGMFGP